MKQDEQLPEELLWAEGGHASDVALTALADGEHAIVTARVREHVALCSACSAHLGNAALLSLHAGRELAVLHAKRELPRVPIALGLLVALLGLVPTLITSAGRDLFHDTTVLASGLRTIGQRILAPGSPSALVLTYGAAFVLLACAVFAIRLLPKKETPR